MTLATLAGCKRKRVLVQAAALFRGRVNGKGIIVKKVVYDILKSKISGGYSNRGTPVPISNTEVKFIAPMILVWRRTGKVGTAGLN